MELIDGRWLIDGILKPNKQKNLKLALSRWSPYGTRMYQQALFREMYIIAEMNGTKWSVHGMYMEMYMECTWNVPCIFS